jgi:hypothetical protein
VGDHVFLKLQPFCQRSVADRPVSKLTFRFFGPFEVIKQINPVAYELALPSRSAIHPVFHVSQLKSANGVRVPSTDSLPDIFTGLQVLMEVLESRLLRKGGKVIRSCSLSGPIVQCHCQPGRMESPLSRNFHKHQLGSSYC